MSNQSLDERIARVAHATAVESSKKLGDKYNKLKRVSVELDTKALKQLIRDVITEVLPEKTDGKELNLATSATAILGVDPHIIKVAQGEGWDKSIYTIQKNVEEIIG